MSHRYKSITIETGTESFTFKGRLPEAKIDFKDFLNSHFGNCEVTFFDNPMYSHITIKIKEKTNND